MISCYLSILQQQKGNFYNILYTSEDNDYSPWFSIKALGIVLGYNL